MKYKARDYQEECLTEIAQTVEKGENRALVVMASALGKTITSAFALQRYFAEREFGRVLVLCHSDKILRQSKERYRDFFGEEYSYGMYIGKERASRQTDFLFATFQTMKEHRKEFPKDTFAYVVVDEAHHSKARTYFPTIHYFQPEFLLGLTATPDRLDGQKIEEIYGDPVYELDFIEATNRGLIAECDYRLVLDDLSQEKLDEYLASNEKISINQLNRTLFIKKRDEEIVRLIGEYSAEVENPRTMIFCKTIEHAQEITRLLGDKAALMHSGNADSVNYRALEDFRNGEINTIVSIDMLNEGIDVPDANIVVFLRNTVSPSVFYQQLGRGTRLSEGKEKVLVLDFVNNCNRIQMILELKQQIDDFRIQNPVKEPYPHGAGEADSREKFTLNIATPEFRERTVDVVRILAKATRWRGGTREDLIRIIIEKTQELGRTPRTTDIDADKTIPSVNVFLKEFLTWENAIEAAGIEYYQWTDDKIIVALQKESIEGVMPSAIELDRNPNLPNYGVVCSHFKSLQKAANASGLKMKRPIVGIRTQGISDDDMLYMFYQYAMSIGHWPSVDEVDSSSDIPHTQAYRSRFACGVKELPFLIMQKYDCSMIDGVSKWNQEMIAENFRRLILEKGRMPTEHDVNTCVYLPMCSTCRNIMKTGLRGIYTLCRGDEILGIAPKTKIAINPDEISKIRDFVKRNKRKVLSSDLSAKNGLLNHTTLVKRGWNMKELNELIGTDMILAELNATD